MTTGRRTPASAIIIGIGLAFQLAVAVGLLVAPVDPGLGSGASPVAPAGGVLRVPRGQPGGLGLIGPYDPSQFAAMRAAGVTQTLVELSWAQAEPQRGQFDFSYLANIADQIAQLRHAGFQVALNTGIYEAPQWLLHLPGARFVDQYGEPFTAGSEPNLVFDRQLRPLAQAYLDEVFSRLGTDFSLVRAGGGHFGELTYPSLRDGAGNFLNRYWAYDAAAAASDPVPGWRPGDPSPDGQAQRFYDWYVGALVDYQNWQVRALRTAGYDGWVAMLYPSYGFDPDDLAAALAADLAGTTPGERGGEVQRGYDWEREIAALDDPKVVVYGTYGENAAAQERLAALAAAHHRPAMAENSGGNTTAQVDTALASARANDLDGFWLVRASDFFCGCDGYAQLSQVSSPWRK